jgi:hypothetical protein
LIVMLSVMDAVCELASVTCAEKVLVPALVGVPEITPVPESSVSPAGREPLVMDQVYGDVPPVTASVALYAKFRVPLGKEPLVTLSGPIMVRLSVWVAETELESVTRTEKLLVPATVGVPEIIPVPDPSVRPAGREPEAMDHV